MPKSIEYKRFLWKLVHKCICQLLCTTTIRKFPIMRKIWGISQTFEQILVLLSSLPKKFYWTRWKFTFRECLLKANSRTMLKMGLSRNTHRFSFNRTETIFLILCNPHVFHYTKQNNKARRKCHSSNNLCSAGMRDFPIVNLCTK